MKKNVIWAFFRGVLLSFRFLFGGMAGVFLLKENNRVIL